MASAKWRLYASGQTRNYMGCLYDKNLQEDYFTFPE